MVGLRERLLNKEHCKCRATVTNDCRLLHPGRSPLGSAVLAKRRFAHAYSTFNKEAHAQDVFDTFSLFGRRGDSAGCRTRKTLKIDETAPAGYQHPMHTVMS